MNKAEWSDESTFFNGKRRREKFGVTNVNIANSDAG
jgi:hypothetical protein